MRDFKAEYVHCVEDKELWGKYGYFSDNIDTLRQHVSSVNLKQWGMLDGCPSTNSSFPFVKENSDVSYRFFYHDPGWAGKSAPTYDRIATNRELALWLAHGNGEIYYRNDDGWWYRHFNGFRYTHECTGRSPLTFTEFPYPFNEGDNPVREVMVRAWSDTKWHEPTAEYLGLEE